MRAYLPAFGEVVNVTAERLPEDHKAQVNETIIRMNNYSSIDGRTPEIIGDAISAARLAGDPVAGNFSDVRARLRFVGDDVTAGPFQESFGDAPIVETLVRPIDMRRMADPQGDCDDFSMTIRARMLALGIPAHFVTVAVDPDNPDRYSHVYVVADCDGGVCGPNWTGRVALDTSHGAYPGWECPNPYGMRTEWRGSRLPALLFLAAAATAAWWYFK